MVRLRTEKPKILRSLGDAAHRWRLVIPMAGHPLHGDERYRPFFIVSAGRSGTTLLRRVLCRHPELFIPDETSLKPVIARYRRYRRLSWSELVSFTLAYFQFSRLESHANMPLAELVHQLRKAPREHRNLAYVLDAVYRFEVAQLTGHETARWGDKTPANVFAMEQILEVFPDARFVHLYRDGCDVIHSFVERGFAKDLESAAARWASSVRAVERFERKHPASLLNLRYEDLVSDPEAKMRAVCEFLGVAYSPELLEAGPSEDDTIGRRHSSRNELLGDRVSATSIGKGRRSLSSEELLRVGRVLNPWLARLGYAECG